MNRKAYVQDFIFFAIVVVVLAIIGLFGGRLMTDLNNEYQNSTAGTQAKSISSDVAGRFNDVFDWIFIGVFFLFALAIIGSFFMLDTNPVLFFGVIVVFAFILIAIGIMGNAFDDMSSEDALSDTANDMPVLSWLMSNILETTLVLGFIGIIVLFAKLRAL